MPLPVRAGMQETDAQSTLHSPLKHPTSWKLTALPCVCQPSSTPHSRFAVSKFHTTNICGGVKNQHTDNSKRRAAKVAHRAFTRSQTLQKFKEGNFPSSFTFSYRNGNGSPDLAISYTRGKHSQFYQNYLPPRNPFS